MSRPPDDPGIEHEPHLRPGGFTPDPSEAKAAVPRARSDDVEHTVWDEPAQDSRLSGQTPADALTVHLFTPTCFSTSALGGELSLGITPLSPGPQRRDQRAEPKARGEPEQQCDDWIHAVQPMRGAL